MNLENLNLVELNAQEMQNVDGGWVPLIIIGAALLLAGCTQQNNNNESNSNASNTMINGNVAKDSATQVNTEVSAKVK